MKVLCYTITRWRKRNAAYTKGWKRSMSEKVIMLGNEAIARGAYEAGARMDGYTLVVLMVLFLSNRLFLLTMIFFLLW